MRMIHVWGWALFSIGVVKVFWLEYQLNVLHAVNHFDIGIMVLMFLSAVLIIGGDKK